MKNKSNERLIAYISVLKKHKITKFANSLAKKEKDLYLQYNNSKVDILVNGSLKTYILFLRFLEKYIKKNPPRYILILLNLALYEYFFMETKVFAVLDEWVNLSPAKFKKLVNAVLRNVSRDYTDRNFNFNYNDLFPKKILDFLDTSIPEKKEEFIESFLSAPSIFLNTSDDKLEQSLIEKYNISCFNNQYYYLKDSSSLKNILLETKNFYIQDLAPQIILNRLVKSIKLKKLSILDMCSAPGGKTIGISFLLKNKDTKFFLTEKNPSRILKIEENLKRLNLKVLKIKDIDASIKNYPKVVKEEALEHDGFDLVVVDAPCSSLGTVKRHPELLLRIDNQDYIKYQNLQLSLLDNAFKSTKKGGLILYTVCSFTQEETKGVTDIFLNKNRVEHIESEFVFRKITDKISSDIHYYSLFKKV